MVTGCRKKYTVEANPNICFTAGITFIASPPLLDFTIRPKAISIPVVDVKLFSVVHGDLFQHCNVEKLTIHSDYEKIVGFTLHCYTQDF